MEIKEAARILAVSEVGYYPSCIELDLEFYFGPHCKAAHEAGIDIDKARDRVEMRMRQHKIDICTAKYLEFLSGIERPAPAPDRIELAKENDNE